MIHVHWFDDTGSPPSYIYIYIYFFRLRINESANDCMSDGSLYIEGRILSNHLREYFEASPYEEGFRRESFREREPLTQAALMVKALAARRKLISLIFVVLRLWNRGSGSHLP